MKYTMMDRLLCPAIAATLALLAATHPGAARADETLGRMPPVEDAAMAHLTGGFVGSDGVTVAFAIEVEGLVNGVPVMEKSLAGVSLATGTPKSLAAALLSCSKAMTLILKNSTDHQSLQLHTVLNVGVTEMTAMRALQTQSLISSGPMSALRP